VLACTVVAPLGRVEGSFDGGVDWLASVAEAVSVVGVVGAGTGAAAAAVIAANMFGSSDEASTAGETVGLAVVGSAGAAGADA